MSSASGITSQFNAVKNANPNSDTRLNADPTVSVKVFNLVNTSVLKAGEKSTMKAIAG